MRSHVRRTRPVLLIAALGLAGGCDAETRDLVTVPTVQQANEIAVALAAAGVHARVDDSAVARKSAFVIRVAPSSEAAARQVLVEKNLPREPVPGFEQLGQSSLILSAADQQQRSLIALSGELSRTLEAVDGVIRARVHIAALPPATAFGPLTSDSPPTATVLLRIARPIESIALTLATTRPAEEVSPQDKIRRLVAQAVPGLTPDRVSVMTSLVPPADPALAATRSNDERDAAVATTARLRAIVIALAAVSVVSIGVALLQAVRRRRA